ncbi:MAG: hypothetical protein H6717_37710 [Polyangiaceae bacterium]|nr:hypothetical protein [Polyangiaceae bacterium]
MTRRAGRAAGVEIARVLEVEAPREGRPLGRGRTGGRLGDGTFGKTDSD